MVSSRLIQNILIALLVVLLGLGVWWGVASGTKAGQSTTILKDVAAIKTGLGYFYADQDRYPTALEFADKNTMLDYFSPFPPQNFANGNCQQTYVYKSPTASSYELNFCLPKAKDGFVAGWNKITQ